MGCGTSRGSTLLLGADVGGTRARLRLHLLDPSTGEAGEEVLRREGPGANPGSAAPGALEALLDLVAAALGEGAALLAGADPDGAAPSGSGPSRAEGAGPAVRAVVVLGIAGAGPARHGWVERAVREGLGQRLAARSSSPCDQDLLDPVDVQVVDDMVTAFAAGGTGGDGLLLLAGTGAAAVRFAGHRPVERSDGMGWLLGDAGSAVWIGREVLRAAAADLDRRGPSTALSAAVLGELGLPAPGEPGAGDVRQAMIATVDPLAPAAWGRFAPLASDAAAAGDAAAERILDGAAEALLGTLDAVRDPGAGVGGAVVVTGSVLERSASVRSGVRAGLEARGLRAVQGAEPVHGALRLAAEHAARSAGEAR